MRDRVRYSQGKLFLGDQSLHEISQGLRRPTYVYSAKIIETRLAEFRDALPKARVHFAMKANHHPQILGMVKNFGMGVDVVSAGELDLALETGFSEQQIIYSGVGKTASDLLFAVEKKIRQINVESFAEVVILQKILHEKGDRMAIALRINPDVSVKTHRYISTAQRSTKFGISKKELPAALALLKKSRNIRLEGLSVHVGSLLTDLSGLAKAIAKIKALFRALQAQGFPVQHIDVGGGLGFDYKKDALHDFNLLQKYSKLLRQEVADVELVCEPGRFLVGRGGCLLTPVTLTKDHFIVTESGMQHLLRPPLYDAYHRVWPVLRRRGRVQTWDVVGPVCETADFLGLQRRMVRPREGDWLAVLDTGAYGEVMANDYNLFPRPDSLLV